MDRGRDVGLNLPNLILLEVIGFLILCMVPSLVVEDDSLSGREICISGGFRVEVFWLG